jgi:hypothetical protein
MRGVLGAVVALVMAGTAAAQECAERGLILSLADRVLAGRPDLGRFQQRNYGTEAVYLKLMYGGVEGEAALDLFEGLIAAKVRGADDAMAAMVVADSGVAAGLATLDPDPAAALARGRLATARAVLLADPTAYFALRAEGPPDLGASQPVALLVADQPDAVRARIAEAAEAAGDVRAAALLLADMADPAGYEAFVARHAGAVELELDVFHQGSGLRQRDAPFPHAGPRPVNLLNRGKFFVALKAVYHDGQQGFLSIVMNQTGDVDASVIAAQALLAAIAAGLEPWRDPEGGWALQAMALEAAMGTATVRLVLSSFDWPSRSVRHYAGKAGMSLGVMLARRALAPVARDNAVLPARPTLTPEDFPWDVWVKVAGVISGGGLPVPADAAERIAAIELLDAVGRTAEAADMAGPLEEAMPVWRDLMIRLDRRCAGFTVHPGEALWLGGEVLYKF